jgi:hypothetical protein
MYAIPTSAATLSSVESPEIPQEELIDEQTLSERLNVKPRTLQGWRLRGEGPPYIKVGRLVRYRPVDIQRYLNEQTRHSTSQEVTG